MSKNKYEIALSFCVLIFGFYIFAYAQEDFLYDSNGKRNPFVPLVTSDGKLLKLEPEESSDTQGLLLEGIIYDKSGMSYAIVNRTVVKVGDMVGDTQVLKINKDKVIFIKEGLTLEVELRKGEE